jgi:DNA-binding MarR family transcriptional regulator
MESTPAGVQTYPYLLRAHSALNRALDARLLSRHGLTLRDYEVLYLLWEAPNHKMRRVDLSRRLLLTQSGMTRLLKGLEDQQLVERTSCNEDARVFFATLTTTGKRKFPKMRRLHLEDIQELFGQFFSNNELDQLRALLSRICPKSAVGSG